MKELLELADQMQELEKFKKTLLVEYQIECPNCGKQLYKGDIMYEGEKVTCGYCKLNKQDEKTTNSKN